MFLCRRCCPLLHPAELPRALPVSFVCVFKRPPVGCVRSLVISPVTVPSVAHPTSGPHVPFASCRHLLGHGAPKHTPRRAAVWQLLRLIWGALQPASLCAHGDRSAAGHQRGPLAVPCVLLAPAVTGLAGGWWLVGCRVRAQTPHRPPAGPVWGPAVFQMGPVSALWSRRPHPAKNAHGRLVGGDVRALSTIQNEGFAWVLPPPTKEHAKTMRARSLRLGHMVTTGANGRACSGH